MILNGYKILVRTGVIITIIPRLISSLPMAVEKMDMMALLTLQSVIELRLNELTFGDENCIKEFKVFYLYKVYTEYKVFDLCLTRNGCRAGPQFNENLIRF